MRQLISCVMIGISMLLFSCASSPTITPTPLTPLSVVADAFVWIEDQCEDPVEDAQTITSFETMANAFLMPAVAVVYIARITAIFLVAVPIEYFGGAPVVVTIEKIKWILPYPLAGPDPDRVSYKNLEIQESCLLSQEEDEGSGPGDVWTRQRMYAAR